MKRTTIFLLLFLGTLLFPVGNVSAECGGGEEDHLTSSRRASAATPGRSRRFLEGSAGKMRSTERSIRGKSAPRFQRKP